MKLIKTGINYSGNKFKYMNLVNQLIRNKNFYNVYDLFLGSGNLLLNLNCNAKRFIGNDTAEIFPQYFKLIQKFNFKINDFRKISLKWDNFNSKKIYYEFRKDWNKKYLNKKYDKSFIISTSLLSKLMFKGSFRFNKFNRCTSTARWQRGISKLNLELLFNRSVNILNELKIHLNKNSFYFSSKDFITFLIEKSLNKKNNLLILDPPYILCYRGCYNDLDFNEEKFKKLIHYLKIYRGKFIGFDYLNVGLERNLILENFIKQKNIYVHVINNHIRKSGIESIEILYTNIKEI